MDSRSEKPSSGLLGAPTRDGDVVACAVCSSDVARWAEDAVSAPVEAVEGIVFTCKPHPCVSCEDEIPKGVSAQQRCWLFDGIMIRQWRHLECGDGPA